MLEFCGRGFIRAHAVIPPESSGELHRDHWVFPKPHVSLADTQLQCVSQMFFLGSCNWLLASGSSAHHLQAWPLNIIFYRPPWSILSFDHRMLGNQGKTEVWEWRRPSEGVCGIVPFFLPLQLTGLWPEWERSLTYITPLGFGLSVIDINTPWVTQV